ncbi:MAG TPA: enoyl-CoA hydratase/isomerase family protein [Dongiaceae bacterium]|jgi:enoyl-CoA hydratase/carnithine racemase|nr:enoyl-CoA hydratase/isomerase family protein [Dongiaceae bacterium]
MTKFADYSQKYRHIKMSRSEEGVLELTLHSNGKTLVWGAGPHEEFCHAFRDIGADRENRVIIMTGTGSSFIEEVDPDNVGSRLPATSMTPHTWDHIYWNAKHLLMDLLDIEVPMIAAVNGPVFIHAELAVLCDIVLAADHAVFQDAPHFPSGLVPGDGVHVVWPLVLGVNRGRYFLLTGEKLTAQEAHRLGVVAEIMPQAKLMTRARALAKQLLKQPPLTLRYARVLLTQQLKRAMLDQLGPGLALQGLGANAYWPPADGVKNTRIKEEV